MTRNCSTLSSADRQCTAVVVSTCTIARREQISCTRAGTRWNMSGLQATAEYGEAREVGVREERRRRQKVARRTILGKWRGGGAKRPFNIYTVHLFLLS